MEANGHTVVVVYLSKKTKKADPREPFPLESSIFFKAELPALARQLRRFPDAQRRIRIIDLLGHKGHDEATGSDAFRWSYT